MNTCVIRRAILGAFYSYQNPQEIRVILFNQDLCLAFNRLVIEKDNAITVRQEIDFLSEDIWSRYSVLTPGINSRVKSV